jgi:hypothetical protein
MSRGHKLAIFSIMTSRVDVAGYFGQFHFLNTSEKSLGLDFKPFGQNPTFGLKCEKNIKFQACQILQFLNCEKKEKKKNRACKNY